MSFPYPAYCLPMFLNHFSTRTLRVAVLFASLLMIWLLPHFTQAEEGQAPLLRETINDLLREQWIGPEQPLCPDEDFVRRAYLDLLGRIPSATEARAFLDDKAEDKRAQLVDRLLDHPRYAHHMANVFDVMLMERRPDKHVKADQWQGYLLASFQENKPYNQLASEILGADGANEQLRAASKFYLDRDLTVDLLTRDVGRVFFGMDLECAQCHDHPLIGDYFQADYYGIYAFLTGNYLFQPDKKKPALIGEKVAGSAKFKSVFTDVEGMTRPRLPGETQQDEPTFAKGDEYQAVPDDKKKVRGVPKYSRRQRLAELIQTGTNRAFSRNIANRLWAHMMGRGLVHPVELHHGDNPPSHPQLLETLTDALPKLGYDMKAFLRELALSDAYQRKFALPDDLQPYVAAAEPLLAPTTAELATLQAEIKTVQDKLDEARAALRDGEEQEETLNAAKVTAEQAAATAAKKLRDLQAALAKQKTDHTQKAAISTTLADAAAKATEVAKLTPEDAELKKASEVLTAKSAGLVKQVAALQAEVDKAQKAIAPVEAEAKTSQQALEKAVAAWTPVRQQVAARRNAAEEQRQIVESQQRLVVSKQHRLRNIETLLAYRDAQAAVNASTKQLATAKGEVEKASQQAAAATAAMQAEQGRVQEAEKMHAKVTAELAAMVAKQKEKQAATQLLETSLTQVRQALQKLSDQAAVEPSVKALETSIAAAKAESDTVAQEATAQRKVVTQADEQRKARRAALSERVAAEKQSMEMMVQVRVKVSGAEQQLRSTQAALDDAGAKIAERWSEQLVVSTLAPLSNEQLAWSLFQATGVVEQQRRAAEAELAKKAAEAKKKQELADSEKQTQLEQAVVTKLAGSVKKFTTLFAAAAGQPQNDFFATVDQALFFANSGDVQKWTNSAAGNLTERLAKIDDTSALASELYLSILTRQPNAEEIASVNEYIQARNADKPKAVQELVWALLASAEFRFQR